MLVDSFMAVEKKLVNVLCLTEVQVKAFPVLSYMYTCSIADAVGIVLTVYNNTSA